MKVALVTGASSGIGLAITKKLLKFGVAVIGMNSKSEPAEELGENFTHVKGDISKSEDRQKFVETAMKKHGRIDYLVNVAGVAPTVRTDILSMSEDSYDRVMDINAKGTLFLTQLVANKMLEGETPQGKAIVNISSISAYTSSTSRGEYCISKSAVSMITTLFADRLSEYGISVNEVRPGIINTRMTEKVKEKYDALIDGGLLPIKRWGEPEDVAEAVYVLLSGALPYVTGQVIDVDGGFHIRRL